VAVQDFAVQQMSEFYPNFQLSQPEMPTFKWLTAFEGRNSMKEKIDTPLEKERAEKATVSNIGNWFDNVYTADHAEGVHFGLVANLDETMINSKSRLFCVVRSTDRFAVVSEDEEAEHITMLSLVTYNGDKMAPLLIFPRKTLPSCLDELVKNKSLMVSGQSNGWMDQRTFKAYAAEIVRFANLQRRKFDQKEDATFLLFSDSHSSREDPETLKLFRDNHIKMITFPSHCTHILQPLDVGIFSPFKKKYKLERRAASR